jgi:hypothetical protein
VALTDCRCKAGYWGPYGVAPCAACVAGKFKENSGEITDTCKACGAGTYKDLLAQTDVLDCNDCVAGTYKGDIAQDSASDCIGCPKGYQGPFPKQTALSSCFKCGLHKYADAVGSSACKDCNVAWWIDEARTMCKQTIDKPIQMHVNTKSADDWSLRKNSDSFLMLETVVDETMRWGHREFFENSITSLPIVGQNCSRLGWSKTAEVSWVYDAASVVDAGLKQTEVVIVRENTHITRIPIKVETRCQPGNLSALGGICKPCESGKYQDETDRAECKLVPAGYQATPDRSGLEPCPDGT